MPKLRLSLPPGQKALRITLDGKLLEKSGDFYFLDPGDYRVTVEPEGSDLHPYETKVSPRPRGLIELKVQFDPIRTPKATGSTPTQIPPRTSSGPPAGALVLGGLGILLAGWGGYTWQDASSKHQQFVDRANRCNPGCPPQEQNNIKSGAEEQSTRSVRGQVTLGIGLGSIALGALWWGLSSSSNPPPASTGVALSPLQGGGYVNLRRGF